MLSKQRNINSVADKSFLIPGTFSRVYLCQHKQLRKYQALKIIPVNEVVRHNQVQHVKNEREILKVDKFNPRIKPHLFNLED